MPNRPSHRLPIKYADEMAYEAERLGMKIPALLAHLWDLAGKTIKSYPTPMHIDVDAIHKSKGSQR